MSLAVTESELNQRPDTKAGAATSRADLSRLVLRYRVWLLTAGHILVFMASFWIAFGFRFDFSIPEQMYLRLLSSLPTIVFIKLAIFYSMGHFHGWWRYVTFSDLASLLKASVLSLLVLVLINHYAFAGQIPRVVVVLDCLVTATIIGSLRASWRLCREYQWFGKDRRRPTLMIGADDQSAVWAHQIQSHRDIPYRIVGFVDDDRRRTGARLGGIPILGTLADLRTVATTCRVQDVLVSPSCEADSLRTLMDTCDEANINLKIIPPMADQISGQSTPPIRDVEINDLLRRDPVVLDMAAISKNIYDSVVVVTGAGGSIGSEICRQLLKFGPSQLILIDNGENCLFLINQELSRTAEGCQLHPYVIDVQDENRLRKVFERWQPDFVFHAAAHKHVGLMESNVSQCVQNNVFGTKCVADLAHEFKAQKFVLISTDKAVNPTSVMGATKQIAERYVHALAQESETAFIVVRFGNVLGSNGSVVPIFKEQIRRGGPVTITDHRMTRFFMTIPEASQLVLQASSMGQGGEIFVLEMGDQIPVIDLARDLIRLSGLPTDAIEIVQIGMRPGEKLFEELYFDEEKMLETSHPKVRAAYHRPYTIEVVRQSISDLQLAATGPDDDARDKLKELVPEYNPNSAAYLLPEVTLDTLAGDPMAGDKMVP